MASRNYDHITSGNVLTWTKREEAQRAQADAKNSITEQKEFDKIKFLEQYIKKAQKIKHSQATWHGKHVETAVASISPGNAWHMARCAWSATRPAISGESAGVKRAEQYMK